MSEYVLRIRMHMTFNLIFLYLDRGHCTCPNISHLDRNRIKNSRQEIELKTQDTPQRVHILSNYTLRGAHDTLF